MVIVDSTVWVVYFRGVENPETAWLEKEIGREPIALIDLILCEVLQGIRSDAQFEDIKAELLEFDVFDSGGVDMAVAAAANYRGLKTKGYTVRKTIDCLISLHFACQTDTPCCITTRVSTPSNPFWG